MKEEKFGYVYLIYNKITENVYIGKKKSKTFLENYYGSGKLITEEYNQYGPDVYERQILKWCNNEKELKETEIKYIAYYKNKYGSRCLNMTKGGEGTTLSNETKLKISKALTGRPLSREHKNRIGMANVGKKHSKETRMKLSKSLTGRVLTKNHKKHISENNSRSVSIRIKNLKTEHEVLFSSINEASDYINENIVEIKYGRILYLLNKNDDGFIIENGTYHINKFQAA